MWSSGGNVPNDASSMVQFVEAVLDCQRRLSDTEPVLVNCECVFYLPVHMEEYVIVTSCNFYAPAWIDSGHIVFALSVCAFDIGHNFCMVGVRD